MGRIAAIDYGSKRTGIAVTDPEQLIASPLVTVRTHELMSYLESYFREEMVEVLVVGHPRKMDYSESESMKQIRFFIQAFRKKFPAIEVKLVDERFTSKLALDAMVTGGMKRSERRSRGQIDKVSASIILQTYLELKNNLRG